MTMLSGVLLRLLAAAEIQADDLLTQLKARAIRRKGPLRGFDRIPRLLSVTSGTGVSRIRLEGPAILLDLDFRGLRYAEGGTDRCELIVAGELPEAVRHAAVGRAVADVVDLGLAADALGSLEVAAPLPGWSGATAFAVEPEWIALPDPA